MDSRKCVVPGCKNRSGPGSAALFFPVPAKNNKVFKKWCVFTELGGERDEKICKAHFRDSDFITCKYHISAPNSGNYDRMLLIL